MKKALVVDDSSTMRKLIGSILKDKAGFGEIIEATNGQEGVDKARDSDISFIATDFNMPIMNGADFVKNIRSLPKYKSIPILVITTDEKSKERSREAGASGWLKKPFQPETLTEAVLKLCDANEG